MTAKDCRDTDHLRWGKKQLGMMSFPRDPRDACGRCRDSLVDPEYATEKIKEPCVLCQHSPIPLSADEVSHWVEILDHDVVWINKEREILKLDDMSSLYCRRVCDFIVRQADDAVDILDGILMSSRWPSGMQASIDYEKGMNQFFEETQNPEEWIKEQPLLIALRRRSEGKTSR